MPVKDLMTAENDYTIRILDNGAVYQFDYNKAPKYLKKLLICH